MINTPSLGELIEKGFKVEITHNRNFRISYSEPITNKLIVKTVQRPISEMDGDARSFGALQHRTYISQLLPNGGKTEIKVVHPAGHEIYAHAVCADIENYNKRRGVDIALRRAYQLMIVCDGKDGFKLAYDHGIVNKVNNEPN
jgi:hypothetical protein